MVVFLCMFVFMFLRVIVLRETVKTEDTNKYLLKIFLIKDYF